MSNLEPPKYVRTGSGVYVATLTNHLGHGLRIGIEKADEYASNPGAWVAHVIDLRDAGGILEVETLLLNTYDTKREAQADVALRIANGKLAHKERVRF
jgi:hypothetical protein